MHCTQFSAKSDRSEQMNYSQGGYQPPNNQNYEPNRFNPPPFGKKIPHFVPQEIWSREKTNIRKLSVLAASGVLLFILLSSVFGGGMQAVLMVFKNIDGFDYSSFAGKWNSAEFYYAYTIIYSVFIVGGPFFIIGKIAKKKGLLGNIPLDKPKNPRFLPLVVFGAFGVCLFGNIITSYIDVAIETVFGFDMQMPEMAETPRSFVGVLFFYLSTAVVPALIEEIALRGIVMQPLRRYGDMFAVLCSSIIFGLMHCNLMQIPFAFIAGIAIGYAVIVTESVWTGVLIHFLNNAFSVTVSIIEDFYSLESTAYIVANVFFYAFIAVGIAFSVLYAKRYNTYRFRKSPLVNQGKNFYGFPPAYSARISTKTLYKEYLVTAPMIIAFIAVAYETVMFAVLY